MTVLCNAYYSITDLSLVSDAAAFLVQALVGQISRPVSNRSYCTRVVPDSRIIDTA